jgi:hypothetical protein
MTPRTIALCAAACLVFAEAAGQEPRAYAGGALMISTQGSDQPGMSPSLPRSGVGGTAVGGTVEIGVLLGPAASVSVEVSLPARFDSVQETDYFTTFRIDNEYRDLIVSALLHGHTPRLGPVRLSVAGGPSLAQESSLQRRADGVGPIGTFTTVFTPYGSESEITRWAIGATVGADLELAVGRHVSIVPEMRVHWIPRTNDTSEQTWFLGLSPWVWRPAIGVRASF